MNCDKNTDAEKKSIFKQQLLNAISLILEMGQVKQINIKNCTHCSFNDVINIEKFNSNYVKIDKKLYKNIGIQNIVYITTKKVGDYENIHRVNPVYFIVNEIDGYIEEENGNK